MVRWDGSSTGSPYEPCRDEGYIMFNFSKTLGASVLAVALMSDVANAAPGRTDFEILMNGRPVGRHVVTVTEAGGITTARISIDMAGRVGPIGFTYAHRCEEQWRGNQLINLTCTDRENRSTKTVSGMLEGTNFVINGSGFRGNAPANILPTSWWRSATLRQNRVVNTRDGKLSPLSATRVGVETLTIGGAPVQATHYRIRGPANTDLWYDANGRWVGNAFRIAGQSFVYRKLTPLAGAPRD
jgi:hypothetical protein